MEFDSETMPTHCARCDVRILSAGERLCGLCYWRERAERAEAVLATAMMLVSDWEVDYTAYEDWKKWRDANGN